MISYWIFLDDERFPAEHKPLPWLDDEAVIVRSYDDFVATITSRGCPAFITFDHDLGVVTADDQVKIAKTGMDCAHWFVDWVLDDSTRWNPEFEFDVHSMNSVGMVNIINLISPFKTMMNKRYAESATD